MTTGVCGRYTLPLRSVNLREVPPGRSQESSLWKALRDGMAAKFAPLRWHATRHEDALAAGIPDVSFGLDGVQGWIELKVVAKWPSRGALRVRHLTREQVLWLRARARAGGRTFLLLRIGRACHVLLDSAGAFVLREIGLGPTLADLPGGTSVWFGRIDFDELADRLREGGRT